MGDSGLDKALTELIKIRASQINGCAFCVQFHLNLARKAGVPQTKLDLVAVWRDAGVFTAREMAALAWTEALTQVTTGGSCAMKTYDAGRQRVQRERTRVSDDGNCFHQRMEQNCDGVSVYASDTTREGIGSRDLRSMFARFFCVWRR